MAVLCTNLGQVRSLGTSEVDVDQVGFCPEGPKSEALHLLPPGEEGGESRIFFRDCAVVISVPSSGERRRNETHSLHSHEDATRSATVQSVRAFLQSRT